MNAWNKQGPHGASPSPIQLVSHAPVWPAWLASRPARPSALGSPRHLRPASVPGRSAPCSHKDKGGWPGLWRHMHGPKSFPGPHLARSKSFGVPFGAFADIWK